jgi:hypothetical protein
MKNKLKIIFNLLFRGIKYIEEPSPQSNNTQNIIIQESKVIVIRSVYKLLSKDYFSDPEKYNELAKKKFLEDFLKMGFIKSQNVSPCFDNKITIESEINIIEL